MAMITINHPDITPRGFAGKLKRSVDSAFRRHRSRHMPSHFLPLARSRYSAEYADWRQPRNGPGKLPLVETGLLKLKVLRGHIVLRGPAKTRVMIFKGLPRYTYVNPPGRFNKVKALEATTPNEIAEFARHVDRETDRQLKKD